MSKNWILSAGLVLFFLLGCLGPSVNVPELKGKICDYNIDCLVLAFQNNCEQSYGTIYFSEQQTTAFIQITGQENEKCVGYLRLIDSNTMASAAAGLDAECRLSADEAKAMAENFDVMKLNCKGPLYEAAKIATSISKDTNQEN